MRKKRGNPCKHGKETLKQIQNKVFKSRTK